ncbi:MAG TPA: hypothetical protein VNO30_18585 [Kofleriaceae bacterium]|nr:hypothetical protein [Kofleriaceae bacterium]
MSLLVAGKLIASYYRMLLRVLAPSTRAEYLGEKYEADDLDASSFEEYDDFDNDDGDF